MTQCLGCSRCETGPVVTLDDGRTVCNYCEDFRHECEARYVMRMPTRRHRVEYIQQVSAHRGAESARALQATVYAMWDRSGRSGKTAAGSDR